MDINYLCEPCNNLKLQQDLQKNTAELGNATGNLFKLFFDSNNGPLGLRMLMLASWPISTYVFWQVSDWGFLGKLAMCVIGMPLFILPGGAIYGLYYFVTVVLKNKDDTTDTTTSATTSTASATDSSSNTTNRKTLIISLILIIIAGIYYFFQSPAKDPKLVVTSQVTKEIEKQTTSATPSSSITPPSNCSDFAKCFEATLDAAYPLNSTGIQTATSFIASINTAERGDRKAARQFNTAALAELKLEKNMEAMNLLIKAQAEDPADVEISSNLAYACVKANLKDDCTKYIKNALVLNPQRTSTWNILAEHFAVLGESDKSLRSVLIAYEFSANKEKTITYLTEQSNTSARESLKSVYTKALSVIATYK